MKKLMISLLMVVAATTTSFAQNGYDNGTNVAKAAVENVKNAPSGTRYGVVENTKQHVIVATPLGRFTIEKKNGGICFMGMTAKLVSAKNGIYKIKSNIGNFTVNVNKGTITKD